MKVIKITIKGKTEKTKGMTMEQAVAEVLIGHPKNTSAQVEDALKKGVKLQGQQGTFYQLARGYQGEKGEYKDSEGKTKRKKKGLIVQPEDDEFICTPEGLAKRLNTTSFNIRKVVRGLGLKRTGKYWSWDKAKEEETINAIIAAVKAAEVPKTPGPKKKETVIGGAEGAVPPPIVEEEEELEEEEDE